MRNDKLPAYVAPLVVFFVIFGVVLFSFFQSRTNLSDEVADNFAVARTETEGEVIDGLRTTEIALNAAAGFINSTSFVSSSEWEMFTQDSLFLDDLDGVESLGYIKVGTESELVEYVSRSNQSLFGLDLIGASSEYGVVVRLAPTLEDGALMLGEDVYNNNPIFNTLARAKDLGVAQLTSLIEITKNDASKKKILLLAPQYKSGLDRLPKNIGGYVYVSVSLDAFMADVLSDREFSQIGLQITTDENVSIFESDGFNEVTSSNQDIVTDRINMMGQTWVFRFAYDSELLVSEDEIRRPMLILVLGSLVAVLVAGVTYLLIQLKEDEVKLEREKEVNKAKDSLLSIASHQLRTPATGVKQYIGMLTQGFMGDLTEQQLAMLEKAYNSNERQLKTINDVLFLARMESGRVVITKNRTELNKLIRSVVDEQQSETEKSNHDLMVTIPKKKIVVHADEHMLRMAIENLLSNAIKYTPNGGSITVRLSASKESVKVTVRDNGVGLSDDDKKNLYTQFTRFENKLSKSVSGTGIGLYLVKQIAEMHDARILVKSSPDEGSAFILKIPKYNL